METFGTLNTLIIKISRKATIFFIYAFIISRGFSYSIDNSTYKRCKEKKIQKYSTIK